MLNSLLHSPFPLPQAAFTTPVPQQHVYWQDFPCVELPNEWSLLQDLFTASFSVLDYKPTVTSDPTYVSQNNSLWQFWGFYLFIYLFVNWLNYRINFAVLCFVMNGLFCTIIVLSATAYYSSDCSLLEVINKIFRYYRTRYPQIGCHQAVVLMDTPVSSSYKDTLSKYIYSCFLQFQKRCKELFAPSVVIPFHAWNHAVVTNLPDFTNLFFYYYYY